MDEMIESHRGLESCCAWRWLSLLQNDLQSRLR